MTSSVCCGFLFMPRALPLGSFLRHGLTWVVYPENMRTRTSNYGDIQ